VSFASTFGSADADPVRRTQYFEMMGHRSIYHDGWKATCPFPGPSLAEGIERGHPFGTTVTEALLDQLDAAEWELYDLNSDPTETVDVAANFPDRLAELRDLWWAQAREFGVLPIASGSLERLLTKRPQPGGHRAVNVFYPDTAPLPFALSPRVSGRPHRIAAAVDFAPGDAGVLATHGNRHGGYALFVADDRLRYTFNYMGIERWTLTATEPISAGASELALEVATTSGPQGPGRGPSVDVVLLVDGRVVGGGSLPYTTPTLLSMVGFSCGYAAYDSVDPDSYLAPFRYSGALRDVSVDVSGELRTDPAAEMTRIMTQQ
jgi:arylsulfatase